MHTQESTGVPAVTHVSISPAPAELPQHWAPHSQSSKVALEAVVIAPAQWQRRNCHYHQAHHHVHSTPAHNHTPQRASPSDPFHLTITSLISPAGSCPIAHHAYSKNFHLHSRIYIRLRPISFSPLSMKNLGLNGYEGELSYISLPMSPLVLYNCAAVRYSSS